VRHEGFDLSSARQDSAAVVEARRARGRVRGLAESGLVPLLRSWLGAEVWSARRTLRVG
jgi:hypothetical protein